jgi:hypothetical protein
LEEKLKKASYITAADAIVAHGNDMFKVPSEKTVGESYLVNSKLGCCSCKGGVFGVFCKHATAVLRFYPTYFPNSPPVTANDRYRMVQVALGGQAQPIEFYCALNEEVFEKENLIDSADVNAMESMNANILNSDGGLESAANISPHGAEVIGNAEHLATCFVTADREAELTEENINEL